MRFLGPSAHDRAWARHALEKFPADAVLYGPYTLKSKARPADLNAIDRTQLYEPQIRSGGGKTGALACSSWSLRCRRCQIRRYAIEARGTRASTNSLIRYVLARSIWSR